MFALLSVNDVSSWAKLKGGNKLLSNAISPLGIAAGMSTVSCRAAFN